LRPTKVILREFLSYCFEKSPAENYILVLSGHGSGAVGDFLGGDIPTSRLGIRDLSDVFKSVRKQLKYSNGKEKIDILGMDSCLMSMAEVANQVHEYVDFMVGAEGFERNTGWPYGRLLELLMARPQPLNIAARDLAKVIVKDYTEYYENYTLGDLSTDLSAVSLAELSENLIPRLRTLASVMKKKIEEVKRPYPNPARDAILLSHWEAQSYKDEQYTDLWDFCDLLARRCAVFDEYGKITKVLIDAELADACLKVRDATYQKPDEGVVKLSGYCGSAFQYSRGLSVFFPWAEMKDAAGKSDLDAYQKLQFAGEAGWHDFLTTYLEQTQRLPRDTGEKPSKLLKTSRLDQRPGIYTTLALAGRDAPPIDRDAPPIDRNNPLGDKAKIGCMKNPAVDWYPCDLITEELTKAK